MNLISCYNCGIILNKDALYFPDIYDEDTCSTIDGNSVYDGEDFIAIIPCPLCKESIKENGEQ